MGASLLDDIKEAIALADRALANARGERTMSMGMPEIPAGHGTPVRITAAQDKLMELAQRFLDMKMVPNLSAGFAMACRENPNLWSDYQKEIIQNTGQVPPHMRTFSESKSSGTPGARTASATERFMSAANQKVREERFLRDRGARVSFEEGCLLAAVEDPDLYAAYQDEQSRVNKQIMHMTETPTTPSTPASDDDVIEEIGAPIEIKI